MNKDSEQIAKLYEAIREVDFFTNNECNFNWRSFDLLNVEKFDFNSLNPEVEYFLESFEKIKADSPTKHGQEDVYEVVLHNGSKFYLHINYIQPSKTQEFIDIKIRGAKIKNYNQALVDYEKHFKDIKEDEVICMIMFKDEEGRTDLTKNVGMSAKELFVTLKNALLDSMSTKGWDSLKAIGARVDVNEDKRTDFYKRLFERFFSDRLPNIFEDNETESKQNLKIVFATR
jgi:hypothetical protein